MISLNYFTKVFKEACRELDYYSCGVLKIYNDGSCTFYYTSYDDYYTSYSYFPDMYVEKEVKRLSLQEMFDWWVQELMLEHKGELNGCYTCFNPKYMMLRNLERFSNMLYENLGNNRVITLFSDGSVSIDSNSTSYSKCVDNLNFVASALEERCPECNLIGRLIW